MIIGAIDFFWQRAEHLRKNRMSHKEMRDEMKNAEGDPHAKGERTRRGREIATNQMLADVPEASVVIVNPEHYAVALKWSATDRRADLRGQGHRRNCRAHPRIRATRRRGAHCIAIRPPRARCMRPSKLGRGNRAEHYAAVAAAIRFAEAMRAKAAKGRWA